MKQKNDVGVIVGRFQVPELHEAHKDLFNQVISQNEKVIVFLGLAPTKVTRNNPLDFEARLQMILALYPDVVVQYIRDMASDEDWSKQLDRQISDLTGPGAKVILYGGRDGFMKHYSGHYPTKEIEQKVYSSGTLIREQVSKKVKASEDFRKGVIWAAHGQFDNPIITVDIAPLDHMSDGRIRVLLARKREEPLLRFIGGFTSSTATCFEDDARREAEEETGGCKFGSFGYVGSFKINDWRYRGEVQQIITAFFKTTLESGIPAPSDDLDGGQLVWVDVTELEKSLDDMVMPEHRQLAKALIANLKMQ